MNPARSVGAAAVCESAVLAGTMASSSGKAIVTPRPFRNVRRGRCFFVMNIGSPYRAILLSLPYRACTRYFGILLRVRRSLRLKRRALHDTHDDGRKLVIVFRG